MFITEVGFREIMTALSKGTSPVYLNLFLESAYSEILGALTFGNYPVSTVTSGSYPTLILLQVHLTAMSILEGGFTSEVSFQNKSYLTWSKTTQDKMIELKRGRLYLAGSGSSPNISPPWCGIPVIQADGRTKDLDLISAERQPSLTPQSSSTNPDAFPGPANGSTYGE